MSNQGPSQANPAYDPLPLTGDDITSSRLYNAPASPGPQMATFSSRTSSPAPGPGFIPQGAAQPRFMGQFQGGQRDSIASTSQRSLHTPSEYGSVYALNNQTSTTRLDAYRDEPSYSDNLPMSPVGNSRAMTEKQAMYEPPRTKSRRKLIIGAIIAAIVILAAVAVAVYFTVIKPKNSSDDGITDDGTQSKPSARPSASAGDDPLSRAVVTGGDGSTVTLEDGSTFTYQNKFGGYWYYDPNDPFNNGARAQSWSPALNETFNYGVHKIRGVNVGGWLVTEPFISPALYERYGNLNPPPIDELQLSAAMRADTANGGINQLEEHYKTFITEKDFAEIAAAGLNYVRVPIGFWAIETRGSEGYLEGVSWKYFLKAVKWCRKYGLRINLDLHAVPGSQNGWNHSGRWGQIGFLHGPMGYANAQRALDVIRVLAEFISQPQYKDVVTMFGIMNEPIGDPMTFDNLARFYLEAYRIVRTAGGVGEGNGPWVSLHDGFFTRDRWANVFPNADRLSLDTHPYMCFGEQTNQPMSNYVSRPCAAWAAAVNASSAAFGLTNAGEWSNAVNDCGLFLNGVNRGVRYEGTFVEGGFPRVGDCTPWTDWTSYTPEMKAQIRQFTLASMDALQDYFFWTWKIGDSLASGRVETPAWSYQLGLREGWMPLDPREATGACGYTSVWNPPFQPWQTGGVGADSIPASVSSARAWPPATINRGGPIASLPAYTQTGAIPTLTADPIAAGPSETIVKTADVGNGWNNAQDTLGYVAEIPGCTYPDPYITPGAQPPSPLCTGAARRDTHHIRRAPYPHAAEPTLS